MFSFEVNDMTCGHCVSTIAKALKTADRDAKVQIDLGRHWVLVESGDLGIDELKEVIKEAGYTPKLAGTTGSAPAAAPPSGGCCGCR